MGGDNNPAQISDDLPQLLDTDIRGRDQQLINLTDDVIIFVHYILRPEQFFFVFHRR